jgi:hypothetical protein
MNQTQILPTPTQSGTTARFVAHAFIALTFFSYGTALMDYFLVYPSRALVGTDEFVAYHALLEDRIIPISVVPFALLTVCNFLLLRFRPGGVPRALVWASLGCLLLDWISTAVVQIPMNLRLNAGKDVALIQAVMDSNWLRVVLETVQAGLAFAMLARMTRR